VLKRSLLLVVVAAVLLSACGTGAQETVNQIDKAETVSLEAALRNAATAQETVFTTSGSYTANPEILKENGMTLDPTITLTIFSANAEGYCMDAYRDANGEHWHISKAEGAPAVGVCS
jgi:type II secretory pathway pseudopilin PulG